MAQSRCVRMSNFAEDSIDNRFLDGNLAPSLAKVAAVSTSTMVDWCTAIGYDGRQYDLTASVYR